MLMIYILEYFMLYLQTIKKFRDDELHHHDLGLEHDAEKVDGHSVSHGFDVSHDFDVSHGFVLTNHLDKVLVLSLKIQFLILRIS